MLRARRWVVIAGVVAGAALVSPAAAAAATAPIVNGSWYWHEQVSSLNTPAGPLAPPTGPIQPPDVPKGDWPVAVQGGQADKVTYFHVDTSAIPAHSTVTSFSLKLKEDPSAGGSSQAAAKLQAVPVTDFFAGGTQGGVWDQRPHTESSPAVPGVRAADGTWTFDLQPIVSRWVDGSDANNGIALVPASVKSDFEVVWSGTKPAPSTQGQFVPPPAASEGSNSSANATPTGLGGSAPTTPSVAVVPTPAPIDINPAPEPSALPAPALAAPTTPGGAGSTGPAIPSTSSSAASSRRAHHGAGTPAAFWLGLIGLLVVGGLAAAAAGSSGEPAARRRGSVLRAVEARLGTHGPG